MSRLARIRLNFSSPPESADPTLLDVGFGAKPEPCASGMSFRSAPFPAIRETASFDGFKQALRAYAGPVVSLFQIRAEVD
jgi:hypothetical protein